MTLRTKPRPYETISCGGETKWKLDALCLVTMRSRTATIAMLLDYFLRHHPKIKEQVKDVADDPKPLRTKAVREAQQS